MPPFAWSQGERVANIKVGQRPVDGGCWAEEARPREHDFVRVGNPSPVRHGGLGRLCGGTGTQGKPVHITHERVLVAETLAQRE